MTFDIALKNIGSRLCQQRYLLGLAIIWVGFVYFARGVVPDFWWKFIAVLLQITVFAFWGIGGMAKSQQTDSDSFVRSIAFKPIVKIKVTDILFVAFLLSGVSITSDYMTDYNGKSYNLLFWTSFVIIPACSGIISEAFLMHYAMKGVTKGYIAEKQINIRHLEVKPNDLAYSRQSLSLYLGMGFILGVFCWPQSGYFSVILPQLTIGYARVLSVLLVGVIIISCHIAHRLCLSAMILLHSSTRMDVPSEKPQNTYSGFYHAVPSCVLFLGLGWLLFIFHVFLTVLS